MNILIPDSWLREYLKTDAKPEDIKKYLSLSGPSVEKIETIHGEPVYDIEVTTNRIDMMSVIGIAREAAAILPRFSFKSKFIPYQPKISLLNSNPIGINISYDKTLCYRIIALKISGVAIGKSPDIIKKRLEQVGSRSLNNIVDITNYVMWEIGHPLHVFDYDSFGTKKLIIREAKKDEEIKSLENKTYKLSGGEIVFDDGTGNIIDLPGIIGTANSVVNDNTKNILLFSENSDPVRIRNASLGLGIRTQAATINEKHPCSDFARTAVIRASELAVLHGKGFIASQLLDKSFRKNEIRNIILLKSHVEKYLGEEIDDKTILNTLSPLGFEVTVDNKISKDKKYKITPPAFRSDDINIPEDLIEEIARIYGYHAIKSKLPDDNYPENYPDKLLETEYMIKQLLSGFGFSEIITYSMLSKNLTEIIDLKAESHYRIENPLNDEHIYLRQNLLPGCLSVLSQNLKVNPNLNLFELSNIYLPGDNILPMEKPILIAVSTEYGFPQMKGFTEGLFQKFGIQFPYSRSQIKIPGYYDAKYTFPIKDYGFCGKVSPVITQKFGINSNIFALELDVTKINENINLSKKYRPIPKYPSVIQDFAFIVPPKFEAGIFIEKILTLHGLVTNVSVLDSYKNTRTFRIIFRHSEKTLTDDEIRPVRQKILHIAENEFSMNLKEF